MPGEVSAQRTTYYVAPTGSDSNPGTEAQPESAPGEAVEASPVPAVVDKWPLWIDGPHLRGANIWQAIVIPELDGLEFKGDGRVGPPYAQEDFNRLAAMGANYVSISGPGLFTETPPYTVDPGVETHLDNLLAMITEADMFATIGFRTGPGRSEFTLCCGGDPYYEGYFNDSVWEDQAAQDAWVEMWRYTAERYGDNPIVAGYKLMVEPNAAGVSLDIYEPDEFYPDYVGTLCDWNQFYPRLVAGIREVDSDTPILVGGMGWSGVAWLPYLQPTGDPRTVYVIHQYAPQDLYTHQEPGGVNTYPGVFDTDWDGEADQFDRAWLDNLLSTVDTFVATHGAPVAVDEYGVNRWVPGGTEFMDDQMDVFEQQGMNYALWEWQTSWKPFAEETHDMDFRLGPDPDNRTEVANDLMDVITRYWARNSVRPSNFAEEGSAAPLPPASASFGQGVPLPPAGHIYHAVYPGEAVADSKPPPEDGIPFEEDGVTLDDLRSYEQHVGKTATWVYFSHNWFRERSFPLSTASWIRDAGSIPYIRLMLRSSSEQNVAEPTFTLDRIINGDFDDDLHAWAREARDFGSPLIVEYGTEVNGEWFAWNGIWNGGGTLDGYGDPAEYDGPERFRDAYRHIIQIAREEGASNISWVFHADAHDIPDEAWNRLELYYPGNEWIDWLGVSVYGALDPTDDEWLQFRDGMDAVYPRLAALSPDKPIALLEFGVAFGNPLGDQAEWAEAALTDLIALRWPRLIGFSWWNEFWQNDDDPSHDSILRVQDNPELAAVFQKLIEDEPKVLGRVSQPTTQAPVAEEPAAETDLPVLPAGPVVDDFEGTYEPDQGWEVWSDEQTDTNLAFALDNEIAHGGSASLRIEFDIAPEGSADISRSFDPVQDWSDGAGLSMWLHLSETTEDGQGMNVILGSGEPETPTPFEAWFEILPESADPSGWILTELPWDRFSRAEWADEGGLSEFDPSQVVGMSLSFGAPDDSWVEGTVWVDDIRLLGEATQSTRTEIASTAPATPTETPQPAPTEAAPTPSPTVTEVAMAAEPTAAPPPVAPSEEGGESTGFCPISVGLILAGLVLGGRGKKWRK